MSTNLELKNKIKVLRENLGMTLEEVAKIVGVSIPTIQRYESGEIANIRMDNIVGLAKALQTTPEYLMGWEDADDIDVLINDLINFTLNDEVSWGELVFFEENNSIQNINVVDLFSKIEFGEEIEDFIKRIGYWSLIEGYFHLLFKRNEKTHLYILDTYIDNLMEPDYFEVTNKIIKIEKLYDTVTKKVLNNRKDRMITSLLKKYDKIKKNSKTD